MTKTRRSQHRSASVSFGAREIAALERAYQIVEHARRYLQSQSHPDDDSLDLSSAEHGLRAVLDTHRAWKSINLGPDWVGRVTTEDQD